MNNDQVTTPVPQPSLFTSKDVTLLFLSQTAADIISTLINQLPDETGAGLAAQHCAFSGGISVFQSVSRMRPMLAMEAFFYPAAIVAEGPRPSIGHISPDTNATIAWVRSGAVAHRFYRPTIHMPIVEWSKTEETPEYLHKRGKECLLEHAQIMHDRTYAGGIMKHINEFTILVTSVENIVPAGAQARVINDPLHPWLTEQGNASFLMEGYGLSWDMLAKEGVVGCMNYSLFDKDGRDRPEWRLFITPKYPNSALDHYRALVKERLAMIIVLCFNSANTPALKIALNAGLCNFLITDRLTANALLAD